MHRGTGTYRYGVRSFLAVIILVCAALPVAGHGQDMLRGCYIPPGAYRMSNLAPEVGHLTIMVGAGKIAASYVPFGQDAQTFSRWLDSTTATIQCLDDILTLHYQDGIRALSLAGHWDAASRAIFIDGTYVDLITTKRKLFKLGLLATVVGGFIYQGWHIHNHWQEMEALGQGFANARTADAALSDVPVLQFFADFFGFRGVGTQIWLNQVKAYLLHTRFYDLTLPTLGTLIAVIGDSLIPQESTHTLTGRATLLTPAVTDSGSCAVPSGIYKGDISRNTQAKYGQEWSIALPVERGKIGKVTIKDFANPAAPMIISPDRSQCSGDLITLEWDRSTPQNSAGKLIAFFNNENNTFESTGIITPSSWLFNDYPIIIGRLPLRP